MQRSLLALACVSTLLCTAPVIIAGCAGNKAARPPTNFHLNPSSTDVFAGDTVTITTRSQNTAGQGPVLHWSSTGGTLRTEDNGNIARVTFDKPGEYTVTGRLTLGGKIAGQDTARIRVRPRK